MSGRHSRNKGARIEREVVHILQENGLAAERVPLSGMMGNNRFKGDVTCPVQGDDKRLEVKARADGFKFIYENLAGNYGLVIRADNAKPLIVLDLRDFAALAKGRAA